MWQAWQKNKKLEKKQKIIIYAVLAAIILLVVAVSGIASYHYFGRNKEAKLETANSLDLDLDQTINSDTNKIKAEDRTTLNVLLAGYGGAGHEGGFLSDIIQIAHFDFPKKQLTFISIPRDLYLSAKDGKNYKVNALMSVGMSQGGGVSAGLELMQKSLSQITGLPIKYFIGIDFVGFQRTIGYELGSIEVNVAQVLDDPWYPIEGAQLDPCGFSPEEIASMTATYSGFELESKFTCRYKHLVYPPGKVKMEGADALAYVRSRHSSSDYDRSRRQVEVLTAIRDKLFKLEVLKDVPKYYEAFSQHVTTNLDLASVQYLVPLLINVDEFTIKSINLSPDNVLQNGKSSEGAFIVIPKAGMNDWTQLQALIKSQI
ncbi:MAG TPA: LCP family protein [Candidatus Woesebacteria bacterium]|nr:LCP family protein [Candidatus Woesebacteria bacterium]